MDPNLIKQLMQSLQSALQILQTAQQSSTGDNLADGTGDDDGDMPDPDMMGGDGGGDDDDSTDPSAAGADPAADPSADPSSGGNLHDRLSKLEHHTGLKKSARGSFSERLDLLEEDLLGELFDGPTIDRVRQLEKAAGVIETDAVEEVEEPQEADEAPETIDLGNLIKAAIAEVKDDFVAIVDQKLAALNIDDEELPDSEVMRKAAKSAQFGKRKSRPQAIGSDDDLSKSIMQTWADEDLDQPATFGDALMVMTRADRSGYSLFPEEELDDLSD